MSIDRMLGDVPGLDGLLAPNYALLPGDSSVYDVNSLGDVTTDPAYLGVDPASSDPFAYDVGFLDEPQVNDPMRSSHLSTYDGGDTGSPGAGSSYTGAPATTAGTQFTADQVTNAQAIVEAGKKAGATDRDIQVAIMAAMVESNLQSLDYGDRDSIGMFQQRDAWGSREDRLDPSKSASMFFLGGGGGQQGLLDIPDRDSRGLGDLAQDVQVSAFPDRYAEREGDAAVLLGMLPGSGETTSGKVGKDPTALVERDGEVMDSLTAAALDAASKEFGSDFGIMQGGHSSYSASGGTHEGLGVVDISVPNGDWVGAVTAMRKIGFAAWVRNVPGYGQVGDGAHIHAVLIDDPGLAPEALQQVQSYLNNDDGLAGSRADDGPRQFVNNRFSWGTAVKAKPAADPMRERVVRQAQTFLGTPFKWGGEDYAGVDAEGFVRGVYKNFGVDLPKFGLGMDLPDPVPVGEAQPGDIIAWDRHPETGSSHVGILVDANTVMSADVPGRVVQLNTLGDVTSAWGIPMYSLLQQQERRGQPVPGALPARDPVAAMIAPHGMTRVPPPPSAPAPRGPGGGNPNPPPNHNIRTGPGGQGTGVYNP